MASAAAEAGPSPGWERLERAAAAAAAALSDWRRRALEAEREVERLRAELEGVSAVASGVPAGSDEELRRLRAENALLTSRAAEARHRVAALLARLAVLERRR